jgi:hypothetical protein
MIIRRPVEIVKRKQRIIEHLEKLLSTLMSFAQDEDVLLYLKSIENDIMFLKSHRLYYRKKFSTRGRANNGREHA